MPRCARRIDRQGRPERLTRIGAGRSSPLRGAGGVQNAGAFCRTVVLIIIQNTQHEKGPPMGTLCHLARPERVELPTAWFVARYSIQLSYGRNVCYFVRLLVPPDCSSALRCKVLLSSLRSSSPAARLHPRGVRSWRSILRLAALQRPSLTQLSYGRYIQFLPCGPSTPLGIPTQGRTCYWAKCPR